MLLGAGSLSSEEAVFLPLANKQNAMLIKATAAKSRCNASNCVGKVKSDSLIVFSIGLLNVF
jgi:hypothetical protein